MNHIIMSIMKLTLVEDYASSATGYDHLIKKYLRCSSITKKKSFSFVYYGQQLQVSRSFSRDNDSILCVRQTKKEMSRSHLTLASHE